MSEYGQGDYDADLDDEIANPTDIQSPDREQPEFDSYSWLDYDSEDFNQFNNEASQGIAAHQVQPDMLPAAVQGRRRNGGNGQHNQDAQCQVQAPPVIQIRCTESQAEVPAPPHQEHQQAPIIVDQGTPQVRQVQEEQAPVYQQPAFTVPQNQCLRLNAGLNTYKTCLDVWLQAYQVGNEDPDAIALGAEQNRHARAVQRDLLTLQVTETALEAEVATWMPPGWVPWNPFHWSFHSFQLINQGLVHDNQPQLHYQHPPLGQPKAPNQQSQAGPSRQRQMHFTRGHQRNCSSTSRQMRLSKEDARAYVKAQTHFGHSL
ncbi:hypothetical protein CROQUDRAFT_135876 [Cronartium quercuum f. sp. fusiforme G11]|uniref:Uncharacterized protein n=1 Tax=Cronartium quercuum f. sp. fusiforme G11 TaxID=708437 RepID=A0A9P6T7D3_9BASI|nr:hypothetical protein CROQUDRAFT_135876 [Cronartium quercuum f. sp. fusiforme G11]